MATKKLHGITIEITRGDIAAQDGIAAVVNAANAQLRTGGGVAGALHRAAGPGLEKECRPLAPISPGQAVITGGHNLPNKHVVHCLGPIYGLNKPEADLLANCYRNSLQLADKNQLDSIAFPAISTGIFGYPMQDAAEVALKTILDLLPQLEHIKTVRLVLRRQQDIELYQGILEKLTKQ